MKKILFPLSLMLVSGAAQAIDSDALRLSGFMSVVGGYSSNKDISYNTQPKFGDTGYEDHFSGNVDTRVGMQLDVKLTDRLSATVQALSHSGNDYDPEASMAFLRYKLNDELTLRAGRFGTPFYTYSDFYNVGHAYPWITPPRLAYFIRSERGNGLDLTYSTSSGDVDHNVQVYYQNSTERSVLPNGFELKFELNNAWGFVYSATIDNLSLRAAYHTADLGILGSDHTANFYTTGGRYEFGRYYVNAEYNALRYKDDTSPETDGWYATLGAYVNDDTQVYVTYEASESDFLGTTTEDEEGFNAGVRWDLTPSIALKAQYTRYSNNILDEDSNVYRIALDTVF